MSDKHGYEQTSVAEIREELRKVGIEEDFLFNSTKKTLIEKALELKMQAQSGTEFADMIKEPEEEAVAWESAEEIEDSVLVAPIEDEEFIPDFGSPKWTDYLLRQLRDNELIGDAPTCDGCRRLVNEFVGPLNGPFIVSSTPPDKNNEGTATVAVRYQCQVYNETHPMLGKLLTVEDIADVNKFNTDEPYNRYQSATAMTRAEGRALRKILQLTSIITIEETSEIAQALEDDSEAWEPSEPITRAQVNVLDLKCKQANIDAWRYINSGKNQYNNIREITKNTAGKMIQKINRIVQGTMPKNEAMGTYKNNWVSSKELEMLA